MSANISIAVRTSNSLSVNSGLPNCADLEVFPPILGKGCRSYLFSPQGHYFVFTNGPALNIVQTKNWKTIATIEPTKAYHLAFSPKSTYLMTWEPFTTTPANPQGNPNLNIYKTEDGSLVKSFLQKKQTNWEPQWSADEQVFSRMVNTDVVFYEGSNFEKIVYRINEIKVANYTLSPTTGNHFVICNIAGGKGQPSLGKLFKYPKFDAQQALASKTFFQADKVEFFWNLKGTHNLLLTSTEVDKTGGSYYGKQGLNFISTSGETCLVVLSKDGPIYSVAWSPKSHEFCVVYGFTPARATIFNLKCEPVFELGSGPRNAILYNPQGNILLLGGFGNLRGHIELWDLNTKKIIGKCEAPDSTHLEWAPDGKHFLTATTAPRLRIANGFKIWHYSGALLFEKMFDAPEELYGVSWKTAPKDLYKEPVNTSEKIKGIETSQPQASKEAYRPPSARNKPVTFKLHDDEDTICKPGDGTPSKAALKQRKKREARKLKKAEEEEENPGSPRETSGAIQVTLTGDAEKDKKIKNLKKKLDAIEKLKEQQAQGKTLEINQIAKINGEKDLLKELATLQV